MRNVLLFCLSLYALIQLPANCQKLFDLGVKGGLNMDKLATDYPHSKIWGGEAGIFARMKPPILPGAQGELLISSMGTAVTVDGQHADIRTLSLLLPVFMIFSIGPVELDIGGYYNIPMGRTWNISGTLTEEGNEIVLNKPSGGTYGLLGGGGIRFGHLYFGARYNYGLHDLATGPYLSDIRNRQTQFYIGWGFFGKGALHGDSGERGSRDGHA